jgi:S1-C subfamily serine protease
VKDYLSRKGVPFVEKDVSKDRAAAQEMMRKTRQMGVPVIAIDDQVVVGFDRRQLDQLLAQAQNAPVSLGLKVADAATIAQKQGGGPSSGAYVGAVTPGSPGAVAGLQPGDVLTAISGRTVGGADDVSGILATLAHGQRVEIVYLRGGQVMRAAATL